ncbi:MAG: protein-L-isoaspartate O-methyltransferase [Sulfurimonas sp.]|nr:protein-L-isoaspartate O-methyltransferase [Sulfurimonas sp.]MBU1216930.1 protein-L-isoaspartate O-methyltransferase [bacterium]MBU1435057.1 protein-L-isoaspartate O-methyltransferase [bacterium]MBU1504162.1 protein-L-isoaspartate O-methyltransferase [bacterium]MBU3939981.1 protein-L-isoaspartate O-methyltransferase [bacterium]
MHSNSELINHLINKGVLSSSNVTEAFEHVDRVYFVGDANIGDIYGDYPLQIGKGQTISQPTTVAMMLEMLDAQRGDKVLDIGSGSGWTTALLAYIVGEEGSVIGMERVEELVAFGRANLAKFGFKNAQIMHAGTHLGLPNETFDRILVSAAAEEFPHELARQLKVGGKLVIPIQSSIFEITKLQNGELKAVEHYGFSFVPLIF